jgi:hypothetical protein
LVSASNRYITQAFTYGELDPGVEIYCYIPDGFPSVSSNKVLKLGRSIYCLKQALAAFKVESKTNLPGSSKVKTSKL